MLFPLFLKVVVNLCFFNSSFVEGFGDSLIFRVGEYYRILKIIIYADKSLERIPSCCMHREFLLSWNNYGGGSHDYNLFQDWGVIVSVDTQ